MNKFFIRSTYGGVVPHTPAFTESYTTYYYHGAVVSVITRLSALGTPLQYCVSVSFTDDCTSFVRSFDPTLYKIWFQKMILCRSLLELRDIVSEFNFV